MKTKDFYSSAAKIRGASLLCGLALSMASITLLAQEPLLVDVSPCVNIESHLDRLTCFDKQAGTKAESVTVDSGETVSSAAILETAPVNAAVVATTVRPVAPSADEKVTEATFGLSKRKKKDEEVFELLSTVSALKERVPGRFQITLENGQVWYQKVAQRYRLEVGDDVRVYPSGWGSSYRLSVQGKSGFVQVERVR